MAAELTDAEIDYFVSPQIFLIIRLPRLVMAIFTRAGDRTTAHSTMAMAESGDMMDPLGNPGQ